MTDETKEDERLHAALLAVLQPLAALMVNSGTTLSKATEMLKVALYQAARGSGDAPVSDSQISLLTGLHRKDVRRLREADGDLRRASYANAATRLIAHWSSDPAYLAKDGAPLALPRADDNGPSFNGLVQELRFDIAAGTLLSHLVDLGLVGHDSDARLVLHAQSYLPLSGSDEMLTAFEKNIGAHLRAAVENVVGNTPANFERASHFNKLSAQSAEALEALARALAEEQMKKFNAEAFERQQQDMTGPDASHRVSFGNYVFTQDLSSKDKGKP